MKRSFVAVAAAALLCLTTGLSAFAQKPMPTPPAKGKMTGKMMPPRDSKGRFMKMSGKKGGEAKGGKMMPMRDEKGRFMKMSGKKGGEAKGTKMMPPRDAKGRFMKKGATSPPPAPK